MGYTWATHERTHPSCVAGTHGLYMTLHVNHVWFILATALRLTGLACTLAGEGEVQRPLAPPLTVVDALGPSRRRRQRRTSCHTIPTCCRAAYSKAPRHTLTCCTDGKCWPGTCSPSQTRGSYRRGRGGARAGCSSRQSTQERCKTEGQQGREPSVNNSAQRELPAHSPLTSYRVIHIVDCSRIGLESNTAMVGKNVSHTTTKLRGGGERAHESGSGRRGVGGHSYTRTGCADVWRSCSSQSRPETAEYRATINYDARCLSCIALEEGVRITLCGGGKERAWKSDGFTVGTV